MEFKTRLWLGMVILFIFIPTCPIYCQTQKEKVLDKKFWTVNIIFVGSTIYDVESTFYALDKCHTYREGNPLMRPLVEAGRPWIYAVQGSIDAGVIYTSYKLKGNDSKLWWILPVALTAVHSIAGTHNIRIAIKF